MSAQMQNEVGKWKPRGNSIGELPRVPASRIDDPFYSPAFVNNSDQQISDSMAVAGVAFVHGMANAVETLADTIFTIGNFLDPRSYFKKNQETGAFEFDFDASSMIVNTSYVDDFVNNLNDKGVFDRINNNSLVQVGTSEYATGVAVYEVLAPLPGGVSFLSSAGKVGIKAYKFSKNASKINKALHVGNKESKLMSNIDDVEKVAKHASEEESKLMSRIDDGEKVVSFGNDFATGAVSSYESNGDIGKAVLYGTVNASAGKATKSVAKKAPISAEYEGAVANVGAETIKMSAKSELVEGETAVVNENPNDYAKVVAKGLDGLKSKKK